MISTINMYPPGNDHIFPFASRHLKESMIFRLSRLVGYEFLRLFQHTFGTHPKQPLPTGYKRDSFHRCLGGLFGVCSKGVLYLSWMCVFFAQINKHLRKDGANESNDSDAIFPTSGTPAAPAASAPVSMVPAPVISRAGTYTPPHFETWLKFVADDLLLAKNFVKWGGLWGKSGRNKHPRHCYISFPPLAPKNGLTFHGIWRA